MRKVRGSIPLGSTISVDDRSAGTAFYIASDEIIGTGSRCVQVPERFLDRRDMTLPSIREAESFATSTPTRRVGSKPVNRIIAMPSLAKLNGMTVIPSPART